jgi:hypothetical protein
MATWQRILLKSLGIGLGIGIGLAISLGFYLWYSSRPVPPKPWNSAAITASFFTADTEDYHPRFRYILENHTDRDYRFQPSELLLSGVLQENSTLTGSGNGKEVKFEDETIFLPAKDHAEVDILLLGYDLTSVRYPGVTASAEEHHKYHEAVKKYVTDNLPNLGGFVAFDETNKYRINFPDGWRTP